MVETRGKSWLLLLIGGILVILFALIPGFIYVSSYSGNITAYWLFGWYTNFGDESGFFNDSQYVAVGSIFFSILLIIGIFFVLSAILTMKGKDIRHKGLIWLIFGIFLLLLPILYHLSFTILDEIMDADYIELFMFNFDSTVLFPIMGILAIVPGIQDRAK